MRSVGGDPRGSGDDATVQPPVDATQPLPLEEEIFNLGEREQR